MESGRRVRVGESKRLRANRLLIGIISDTHGLIRPEVLRALQGSDLIVHAGDIGTLEVVRALESIAPVSAIRGNNDRSRWARTFPKTAELAAGAIKIYLLHNLKEIDFDPRARGFSAVISGHSHRPSVSMNDGVCLINPGSAGPRRFKLPVTIALLKITGKSLGAEIVGIDA